MARFSESSEDFERKVTVLNRRFGGGGEVSKSCDKSITSVESVSSKKSNESKEKQRMNNKKNQLSPISVSLHVRQVIAKADATYHSITPCSKPTSPLPRPSLAKALAVGTAVSMHL